MIDAATEAPRLAARLTDSDPATGLASVAALRRLLEQIEVLQVAEARSRGWSWQAIADALGVTRQSVHEKHAVRRGRRRR